MTAIEQVWNWNNFSGGEGDGFYYGPQGSYRAGEGLDTRRLENAVRIDNGLDTGSTYIGDIKSINPFEYRTFATRLGNTGKIYYNGNYKFDMNDGATAHNTIYGWGKMTRGSDTTTYSYGFSATSYGNGRVHRFDTNFGGVTYNVGGGRQLGQGRQNNTLYDKMAILSLPNRILWAWGNTIFQIDTFEVITKLLDLPKEVDIFEITVYQDTFKIFYNWQRYINGPIDGYIAYWDGTSPLITQVVKYDNSPIRTVIPDGSQEYVIFGDTYTQDLYLVQGLQRQVLRVNIENSENNTRILGYRGVAREGIIYIPGTSKAPTNYAPCLYSYGRYYPGSPNSLVPGITLPGYSYSNVYLNVGQQSLDIYIDNLDGDNGQIFGQSYFLDGSTNTAGQKATIYSYPMTGNIGVYTTKSLKHIYVSYETSNQSDHIKIYVRKNSFFGQSNTTSWVLLKDITGYEARNKRGIKIGTTEISQLNIGDFNKLEFKVELIAGYSTSPILYGIKTVYFDNVKD